MKNYIPELGDIIWIDLDPTKGKEQSGRRPVLILTPKNYNNIGLCLSVPISSKIKGYKSEVKIKIKKLDCVILTNHVRTHDWTSRNVKFITKVDSQLLDQVKIRIKILLGL